MRTHRLFRLLAAALIVASLSACNTIHGAGRDIQKAGEVIQDSANTARR